MCADLNQTTDDIKTNDEKESSVVLENNNNIDDNVSYEEVTTDDVAEVEVDNNNNTNCSEVNCVSHKDSKINNNPIGRDFRPIGMDMRDILKTLGNQDITCEPVHNPTTCIPVHHPTTSIPVRHPTPRIPVYNPTPCIIPVIPPIHKVSFAMGSQLIPAKSPKYTTVKSTSPITINSFSFHIHFDSPELIHIG